MDNKENSPEPPESPEPSGAGLARDVRHLRVHGAASAAELREFLSKARGRSPQEVLGMVAGSRLTRSMVLATFGTVLVLVVGSVVPWLMNRATADGKSDGSSSANAAAASPAETEKSSEAAATPETADPTVSTAASAPVETNPKPNQADAEKAVNVMGLGDTKAADPKSNPLEKKLDSLLDNLE